MLIGTFQRKQIKATIYRMGWVKLAPVTWTVAVKQKSSEWDAIVTKTTGK
jgi:hypothetical protein